ncbi:FkbM family methyltransferase [Flavobacteriaceae bacterium]|nr:FkbM family methyltransferase [Flavobacteriaceae bacterium]MDB2695239.1 FkbM family methyltransferase [Flavobacteriaceae bacterium]MDC6478608.1 FkbM family methyltransferase [Flavobacteriaceae bacterium]
MKSRGLFINNKKQICSIYESGLMVFNSIKESKQYDLDYIEVNRFDRIIQNNYDFYIFNYHHVTMGWLDTKRLKNLKGLKITIVLEMTHNDPFRCVSSEDFDVYLVLDPTLKHFYKNVYSFPRPLDSKIKLASTKNDIPLIGSFGLSIDGKGYEDLILAVNKEFDEANIRINIPPVNWVSKDHIANLNILLEKLNKKKYIKLTISRKDFNKEQLIQWCSENTLNVFMYNRPIGQGLAATTDQAICSGKPLAVSTNYTFRHIHQYLTPYPFRSLKESIKESKSEVEKMNQEWSQEQFRIKFESLVNENLNSEKNLRSLKVFKLPIRNIFYKVKYKLKTLPISEFTPPVYYRLKNQFNIVKKEKLEPYIHENLNSLSQFQEDILLDNFFNYKEKGFYIDVGASDPFFNSNTFRFYNRDWVGINIEPGVQEYERFVKERPKDINLNLAISKNNGKSKLYNFGKDSSISTLNKELSDGLNYTIVITQTLKWIFENYVNDKEVDFISIDAEGIDLEVLQSNDWTLYRPKIVLVECNINANKIIKFMDSKNYLLVFNNYINAIFLDKFTDDKNLNFNYLKKK